jgi:hypothetical protein
VDVEITIRILEGGTVIDAEEALTGGKRGNVQRDAFGV